MAKFTKEQRVKVVNGEHTGKIGMVEQFNDTLFLHPLYLIVFDDGTHADVSEPRLVAVESEAGS